MNNKLLLLSLCGNVTNLGLPPPPSELFSVVGQRCPLHPLDKLAGWEAQADVLVFSARRVSPRLENYLPAVLMSCGSSLPVPEDLHRTQEREVLHIC